MPYAIDNQISTEPIAGGVEITDAQYLAGLTGMAQGLLVRVRGGVFAVEAPAEPEPEAEAPVELGPITIFATREYLERFTDEEYAAARYSANFRVQRTLDSMIAAGCIDVSDPAVAVGLDFMVAEGVLSVGRKVQLLQPKAAAT